MSEGDRGLSKCFILSTIHGKAIGAAGQASRARHRRKILSHGEYSAFQILNSMVCSFAVSVRSLSWILKPKSLCVAIGCDWTGYVQLVAVSMIAIHVCKTLSRGHDLDSFFSFFTESRVYVPVLGL